MDRPSADVPVVGAGTTWSYMAWRLSEQVFSCLVLEKDVIERLGSHIARSVWKRSHPTGSG